MALAIQPEPGLIRSEAAATAHLAPPTGERENPTQTTAATACALGFTGAVLGTVGG